MKLSNTRIQSVVLLSGVGGYPLYIQGNRNNDTEILNANSIHPRSGPPLTIDVNLIQSEISISNCSLLSEQIMLKMNNYGNEG